MLRLLEPDISHKNEWEEIIREWADSPKRPWIFFKSTFEAFLEKIERLKDCDDLENQAPKSSAYFLIHQDQSRILGFYWLCHNLNYRDDAEFSGHIGYGVRPSERGKGYAKEGLKLLLGVARQENIGDKMLITCDEDNIASAKVIEANGGVFERFAEKDGVKKRRYWIDLK